MPQRQIIMRLGFQRSLMRKKKSIGYLLKSSYQHVWSSSPDSRAFSRRSFKMSYFIEIPMVHETNLFNDSRSIFYGYMSTDGLGSLWGFFALKWYGCIDFTLNCQSTNRTSARPAYFSELQQHISVPKSENAVL